MPASPFAGRSGREACTSGSCRSGSWGTRRPARGAPAASGGPEAAGAPRAGLRGPHDPERADPEVQASRPDRPAPGKARMNLNLEGKSVVVTGGGSNIGRAISMAFAREGAHLTVAEIDEGQGGKVVAEARGLGAASATLVPTDVTRWASVQAMVREVEGRAGRVDVLVNNVGWTYDRLFVEKERTEWEREIQLNLWGLINCTRAVLDGMIARKGGVIGSMGSDAGRMGEFREAGYGACKAGAIALR